MKKKPDIIVCDEVRREDNGKLMFLGVYAGVVIVRQFPFRLPRFTIVCRWDASEGIPGGSYFLKGPEGKKIFEVEVVGGVAAGNTVGYVVLEHSPWLVPQAGVFRLFFKPSKQRSQEIGRFEARLIADSDGRLSN